MANERKFIKKAIVLGMILSLTMLFCGLAAAQEQAEEEKAITLTGKVTSIDKELGLVFVDGIKYVADFELGEVAVDNEVEIKYVVKDNNNILLNIVKIEEESP